MAGRRWWSIVRVTDDLLRGLAVDLDVLLLQQAPVDAHASHIEHVLVKPSDCDGEIVLFVYGRENA